MEPEWKKGRKKRKSAAWRQGEKKGPKRDPRKSILLYFTIKISIRDCQILILQNPYRYKFAFLRILPRFACLFVTLECNLEIQKGFMLRWLVFGLRYRKTSGKRRSIASCCTSLQKYTSIGWPISFHIWSTIGGVNIIFIVIFVVLFFQERWRITLTKGA